MLLSHFLKNFEQNSGGYVLKRTLVLAKYPNQESYKQLEAVCDTVKYITLSTLPSKEDLADFLQRDGKQVYLQLVLLIFYKSMMIKPFSQYYRILKKWSTLFTVHFVHIGWLFDRCKITTIGSISQWLRDNLCSPLWMFHAFTFSNSWF